MEEQIDRELERIKRDMKVQMEQLNEQRATPQEEMDKIKARKEEQERAGRASHSIAQAAFVLTLFAKEEIFKFGATTDFAMAISKLALATINENGKVFDS